MSVPDSVRIDDGHGAVRTNPQAIRLAALYAAVLAESRLLQAFLEMFPTRSGQFRTTATLFAGSRAKKDVSSGFRQSEFFDGIGDLGARHLRAHAAPFA